MSRALMMRALFRRKVKTSVSFRPVRVTASNPLLLIPPKAAEGGGFEPPRGLHPWQFSRLLVSTAHAPFQIKFTYIK